MLTRNVFIGLILATAFTIFHFAFQNGKTPFSKNAIESGGHSEGKNKIQVALLLDTSGSMEGLIEQAKSQLWNILNELTRTKRNGQDVKLEIALYEYGNPATANQGNQINLLTGFTTDVDLVSEQLFALTTNGGDEYCGAVIKNALQDLEWTNGDGLKVIYIAGNEPFTQGPVSYERACLEAVEKGIIVNTIYCGNYDTGIQEYWKAGALAAAGEYLNINQNQETVYIPTPYDDDLNELSNQLNDTYVPYGELGQTKKSNQYYQDQNALKFSSANLADRAAYKCSSKYLATDWDLVDAYKKDKSILKNTEALPEGMAGLSLEELETEIQEMAAKRALIQKEMQELDKKRRQYKAEQSKKIDEGSLQNSMVKSIREQAVAKGFDVTD